MGATLTKTETTTAALAEHIRERAPEYFAGLGSVRRVRLAAEWHPAYSDVYRFAVEAESARREVVVKVFAAAEIQFRGMQAAWPRFTEHSTFKIAQPLDLLADGPALVMEAVVGTSLHARLPGIAWQGPRLRAAGSDCRRAGAWLRFYHGTPDARETALLDVTAKWNNLEQALAALTALGFDRRRCARLATGLRPLADRLAGRPLPAAPVHGEFTIDNVLIHGDRMTALDVWGQHRQAIQHDLASFLNSLWLLRLSRPAPRSAMAFVTSEFLRGYFGSEVDDPSALLFLQGVGLADVAGEICGRRRSRLARAWIGHVLGEAFETVAALCERTTR